MIELASYEYSIFNFDGKKVAKRVPRVVGMDEFVRSREFDSIQNIFDELERFEEVDFVEIRSKPLKDLSTNDIHTFDRCANFVNIMLSIYEGLEFLLFLYNYKDNYEYTISEASDDFSEDIADVWLE